MHSDMPSTRASARLPARRPRPSTQACRHRSGRCRRARARPGRAARAGRRPDTASAGRPRRGACCARTASTERSARVPSTVRASSGAIAALVVAGPSLQFLGVEPAVRIAGSHRRERRDLGHVEDIAHVHAIALDGDLRKVIDGEVAQWMRRYGRGGGRCDDAQRQRRDGDSVHGAVLVRSEGVKVRQACAVRRLPRVPRDTGVSVALRGTGTPPASAGRPVRR